MKVTALIGAAALTGALVVAAVGSASAGTIFVDTGASSQNFTLFGQGPIAPGIGSFTIGQGASVYDPGTNTSTFTLSGAITGGSPGYNSGTYAFVTTYSGLDTPEAGPNAPKAQSNPSNTNEFFYDSLDPSTTMTFELFGTPTGNHTIPLVAGGNFLGPGFSFTFTTASCTGVAVCGQNNVGLTPGAAIFGPVDISVSFSAGTPEPSTWGLMLLGFAGLASFAGYRKSRRDSAIIAD
jgi:hypothetical protein